MDTDRYNRVVMPHRAYLARYAHVLEFDHHKREELVQETMCLAAEKLDTLKEDGAAKGWLKVIMRNASIDTYRKEEGFTFISMDQFDENNMPNEVAEFFHAPEPDEDISAMWELVDTMSLKDQMILRLHFDQGYTAKEIGHRLNISLDAAEKRIQRAQARLKEIANE